MIAYLEQVQECNDRIDELMNELRVQGSIATKVTATLDLVPAGGGSGDKIGRSVEKLIPIEEELIEEIDRYKRLRKEIKRVIGKVPHQKQRELLRKKYLGWYDLDQKKIVYPSMEEVAVSIGYHIRHTQRIHRMALAAVEKILEK